ncbi:DUF2232 domain-containing protein [Methyloferula stellata]|uniref:DUF2232 domain-containing protein n=1 Tax=Methyloferula stellata TaxID=876270 RepID=UPI000382EBF1|nr:DUF2232 domain-containing protein [Methyloferula stellata]
MVTKTLESPGFGSIVMVGAGLCAALLFTVARQDTLPAVVLACFAPLPIMIATLGFGPAIGLGSVALGALSVALLAAVHHGGAPNAELLAGLGTGTIFAVIPALPAWWLSFISGLARAEGARRWRIQKPEQKTSHILFFFPIGDILVHAAAIVIGIISFAIGAVALGFRGFDVEIAKVSEDVAAWVQKLLEKHPELPGELGVADPTEIILKSMPMMIAVFGLMMLIFNLWLAGRVVLTSDRLPRRWPDIAHELRTPRLLVLVLGGALVLCLMKGWPAVIGVVATVTLVLTYALQGLAVIHDLSRGSRWRGLLLFIVYTTLVFLTPWPLALLALVGLADTAFPLRDRKAALLSSKS